MLCHGWPEHAFSWRCQVPALAAAGYHVIAPNQGIETAPAARVADQRTAPTRL